MAGLSEIEGIQFDYRAEPLWGKFIHSLQHHSENVALVCTHQPKGHLGLPNADLADKVFGHNPYLRLTFRHLGEAVNQWTNALIQRGLQPETPVISFVPNRVEYPVAMWATFKMGCTWVPINPKNLLNQNEAAHMVRTALSWKRSQSAVVIVNDADSAERFDRMAIEGQWTRILVSDQRRTGWDRFSDMFTSAPTATVSNPSLAHQLGPNEASILFTSGTTSLPKGVALPASHFVFYKEQLCLKSIHGPEDVICSISPNNHAIGIVWTMICHLNGATQVFPGATFDPQAMMNAVLQESCTHLPVVPTMVHALVAAKAQSGGQIPSLRKMVLGGSMVTPEVVNLCFNELGVQQVDNLWGMTEGCITASNGAPIQEFMDGDQVAVSYPSPNSRIRICAPQSRTPLPIGTAGELHFSGPIVAREYIGKQTDDFYTDPDGRSWFITGDQARVDERGRVFMTGRYKEMIIRGGENIAPAAIEAVLGQFPDILRLDVQVVGAKDSIAGEVPVAVYRGKPNPEAIQKIQQIVLSKIGPAHIPDQALALADLGLDDYPRTMAGKVKKAELAVLVQDFRDRTAQAASVESSPDEQLASVVKRIWKRALGYNVDEHAPFVTFADSITMMKTRDTIAKETGRQVSVADLSKADTIASQIKMLLAQTRTTGPARSRRRKKQRTSPVKADDVVMFRDKPAAFPKAKAYIETTLTAAGFTWNDIADITPCYDLGTIDTKAGIMDKVSFTFACTTATKDRRHVRDSFRKALANNPLFTSLLVWNDAAFQSRLALHVVMRQTDEFLDQRIHDYGSVRSRADLRALAREYPNKDAATLPGPLLDAHLVFVEETQTVAILMRVHHAIMDASCAMMFFDDIDKALGGKSLLEHVDYQTWGDSYYALRESVDAQVARRWHIDRLRGISSHRKALWSSDSTNNNDNRSQQHAHERPIRVQFEVPDMGRLRQAHPDISAPVVVKTAFALLCTRRSQHTHALFTSQQACRDRFPFVPDLLRAFAGDDNLSAADVPGPTIERVINLVEIRPGETVLALLRRMQSDQDALTKYAAAPAYDILDSLDEHDERPLFLETYLSINFNWVPGLASSLDRGGKGGGDDDDNNDDNNDDDDDDDDDDAPQAAGAAAYDNMSLVATEVRPPFAFAVNAGLGGERGHTVALDFMGTLLSRADHLSVGRELEAIIRRLCDERNWTREVGTG